ncbi:MAG TPA: hypothetical protein VHM01_19150 [Alphaproteobacteria bacterium]|nr:hypothetical protein [Alphaproteobacteria bacterium]
MRTGILLLGMAASAVVHAQDARQLEVTPEKGTAPLGVVLTGPITFVSRAHEFITSHGACTANGGTGRFTIDWGDDAEKSAQWPRSGNPDCKLTHTYEAAGTYRIRAGFFAGDSNAPTPEWVGETTITVTAP